MKKELKVQKKAFKKQLNKAFGLWKKLSILLGVLTVIFWGGFKLLSVFDNTFSSSNFKSTSVLKIFTSDWVSEILVFNKRINFYPIFQDVQYSFKELNVVNTASELLDTYYNFYVYDDGVIKGIMEIDGHELVTLYVDSFFQNEGIGSKLVQYAIEKHHIQFLWALEKNVKAIRFYKRHGFIVTEEKKFEEDTTEYLVKLKR